MCNRIDGEKIYVLKKCTESEKVRVVLMFKIIESQTLHTDTQ